MNSVSFVRMNKQHFIFASKCRYKVFKNEKTKKACIEAFEEVSQKHEIKIEEVNFGEEHTHLLVQVPATLSNAEVAQYFKVICCITIKQL